MCPCVGLYNIYIYIYIYIYRCVCFFDMAGGAGVRATGRSEGLGV